MTSELSVVDLFSGAGGLSLGAARAGFSVRGAVENDPHAVETHIRNFPATDHISTSISDLTGKKILDLLDIGEGELAGVIGGPPCQGFSDMGWRNRTDPRNLLFLDFFRIVAEARPNFFLAENVPGIFRNGYSDIVKDAVSYIEKDYQILEPLQIKANEYGAPTTRTRFFFLGYLKDEIEPLTKSDFEPPSDIEPVFVKDALQGLPEKIDPRWQKEPQSWQPVGDYGDGYYQSRLGGHVPAGVGDPISLKRLEREKEVSGCFGTLHSKEVVERHIKTKPGERDPISRAVRLDLNGFCPTLRAGTGKDRGSHQALRPIHPTEDRVITPREAARLQGFPDWFQFQPTKWHSFRQIGNSVCPIVAERVLTEIRRSLG